MQNLCVFSWTKAFQTKAEMYNLQLKLEFANAKSVLLVKKWNRKISVEIGLAILEIYIIALRNWPFWKKYSVFQNLIYGPEWAEFEFADIKV